MDKKKMAVDCLIKSVEGCRLEAYKDCVGVITIAIGLAKNYLDGTPINMGDTCTESQAFQWLNEYLEKSVYSDVDDLQTQYGFNDAVYASLCSFAYNEGSGALHGDSIVAGLQSEDLNQLANAFRKYIYAEGKIVQGLINRRDIEISYFMKT